MAERFLTLRTNGELYALGAAEIAEVIRLPSVARVPQAPKGLLGLANLRGTVLPVAGLRGLLGVSEAAETESAAASRAIVLDGAAPVALVVDAIGALVSVEHDQIETRQADLAAKPGERLKGAFATTTAAGDKGAVAKILDIGALIAGAFVQQDRARPRQSLAESAGRGKREEAADDRQRLVSFDVAGQEYAFPLESVLEVVDAPETLAALPSSEELVLGVTPYRNTLLPLLSLRGLLGFAQGTRNGREKVVVARVGGALVGLLADRMRTIFPADARLIEKIPPVLAARAGGESKIAAIYRGDGGRRLVSLLSPEQLFREDVMQRLKAGGVSTPEGGKDTGRGSAEERQFVVFRLGEDEFGLPIEAVHEVARVPDQITRLPKAPKFLEGVVNLRGDVLPVVDQRRRFDMPPLEEQDGRRLVVVRTERHRAGLIVDSVSEVLRCPAGDIEPAPDLANESVRLVHGVVNLEKAGRIVLLLDPAELLTRAERGLLDAFQAKTSRVGQ
ncbi:chemotaxis protein CheW [Reyranella sp.]|uniref:chemotaxis protein CheW n=1 Tax=Reyranella sp. TaxID=1929291 RepID=UPI003D0AFE7E